MSPPTVLAVGLGPAGPELITGQVRDIIDSTPPEALFLRTSVHPSAVVVTAAGGRSFDDLYEAADSFGAVYDLIVEELVAAAQAAPDGRIVYAVPGHPRVGEATVARLEADPRVTLETAGGLSFLDLAWDRIGIDPLAAGPDGQGVRVLDGERFAIDAAGERGPLLVAQCWSRRILSDIKLAVPDEDAGAPAPGSGSGSNSDSGVGSNSDSGVGSGRGGPACRAVLLHHLGLADERVVEVDWADLDRTLEPDHLTSLWIPRLAPPVGAELLRLAELVRTLRQRCPWDQQQTHASLTRHLLEESYEVVEAIEDLSEALDGAPERVPDAYAHLEEELGDLLFQVYFHATLGAEEGQFDLSDIARGVHDKLVVRHPHVFGTVEADTAEQVMTNWERIKQAEKGTASVMDGMPANLPSLGHADKAQRKAASVGFDWPSIDGPMAKVAEELEEVRVELGAEAADRAAPVPPTAVSRELGDLLFAVVNVARHAGVDPEAALRGSTREFVRRFRLVEAWAADRGVDLATAPADLVDAQWEAAKHSAWTS